MNETEGLIPRPADVIGVLDYEIDKGGNSATVNAMIAARDEIARLRAAEQERQSAADWINQNSVLMLFRRAQMSDHYEARAERAKRALAEAVAAEREACAKIAKVAWLDCPYGEIADADVMNQLCEHIEAAIRARSKGND
jgi:Cys-tRNA synthase (O-phospho-L-seryl-tRNA:Cys-tRNA synthase)